MAGVPARLVVRSVTASARSAASRLSPLVKPRASSSPFRVSSQKSLSPRTFRCPVEISSVNVMSMMPYHTATASAVLTSMLSVAPRSLAWSIQGL